MSQELIPLDNAYMPALSVPQAVMRFNTLVEFVQTVMRDGVDFGTIPGTPKPTLFKAGAEKLTTLFGLTVRFNVVEKIEEWNSDEPFFYYWYRCSLLRGDRLIAEADGSCNSRESKYRWRWVSAQDVPAHLDIARLVKRGGTISEFTFAVDKAETGGKYGKPLEHWQAFQNAVEAGTARLIKRKTNAGKEMDAWEIDSTLYRVPNEDIASQVNTVQKMSQKRAFVAATLIGVNASEFFTQDLDDLELVGAGTSYTPPAVVIDARKEPIHIEHRSVQPAPVERGTMYIGGDNLAIAAAVKRLRTCEGDTIGAVPVFTQKQAKDSAALELEWIDARRRLYDWLVSKGVGNADGVTLPDLSELDDQGLIDMATITAGL